ncbi:MAG: heavy-metal-associated domain-containing protein [Anaerolineae bacterium]|nr:heavy-metal-associated domain-containing protein [Anaerolineae bacterium]
MENKTVLIPAISCGHCVHTVKHEVGELTGVKRVEVDQETKKATFEWEAPATWEQIASTLKEIEYPAQDLISL